MADLSNGTTIGGFRQLHENLQKPTLFDDLTVPTLQLNDGNTKILEGSTNSVRIQTNSGYVDIGPQNTSLSHFNTDRPKFYFGKPVQINGNIESDGGTRTITGFNLSGNASTQSKLQTARTISLAGDVTGSTTFDGSQNVSITATVANDSHSHGNATITSVDWGKLTNVPSPTITLSGDVTGQQTMTNLGNITITTTVANNSQSVDWSKLTNVPSPTITLSGDVTGQQTMTNLGSITISTTVANDSHTHDTRYYTESEADSRFVNVSGDSMTGSLLYSGDQDYKGIYWGSKYEDGSQHSGAWAYIRQGTSAGQIEIGSDDKIDIYETDSRVLAVSISTNNKSLTVNGNITANTLQINDGNTKILEGASNSVRIQTNSGYTEVGPKNTGWAHFVTDRPKFWFSKTVQVNGNIESYGGTRTIKGFNVLRIITRGTLFFNGTELYKDINLSSYNLTDFVAILYETEAYPAGTFGRMYYEKISNTVIRIHYYHLIGSTPENVYRQPLSGLVDYTILGY